MKPHPLPLTANIKRNFYLIVVRQASLLERGVAVRIAR
jgi:hypothetical protein